MKRRAAGFSLVELLLVLTILSIMAGVAAPNFRNAMHRNALKHTTNTLARFVQYARSEAVLGSVQSRLTFNLDGGGILYSVERDPFNNPGVFEPMPLPVAPPASLLRQEVRIRDIRKATLSAVARENEILFNPDGSTSDTFIYLTDGNDRVATIGIVGLTGQVLTWEREVRSLYED